MKIISLDPRVNRMGLEKDSSGTPLREGEQFQTYEVFHQKKRGQQHVHVGIVHAPSNDLALVFAKESFGRRGATTSIWVVKSSEVNATSYDDSDIFETTPEKLHREASAYKMRDKIEKLK